MARTSTSNAAPSKSKTNKTNSAPKVHVVPIKLTPEQYLPLKREAKKQDRSVTKVVTMIVRNALIEQGLVKPDTDDEDDDADPETDDEE